MPSSVGDTDIAGLSRNQLVAVTAYRDVPFRLVAELEAMNTAIRSITRMGFRKRGTYEFDAAQANDYRTVFAFSFHFREMGLPVPWYSVDPRLRSGCNRD